MVGRGSLVEDLYRAYRPALVKMIRLRCWRCDLDPEDIVQAAFERLLKSSPDAVANARMYLRRAALNAMIDQLRRRMAHPEIGLDLDSAAFRSVTDGVTPERELAARQTLQRIDGALADMSDLRRRIFLAAHLEGKAIREIAGEFGLPKSTVHDLLAELGRDCRRTLGWSPKASAAGTAPHAFV